MERLDMFNTCVVQFGNTKVAAEIMSIDHRIGEPEEIKLRILPDFFAASNYLRQISRDPKIERVIFNDPVTVVIWSDKSKTVVKCQPGDTYSKELGLAMCIAKKHFGNKGNFNEVFKQFIPKEDEPVTDETGDLSVDEMYNALVDHCKARDCYECLLAGRSECLLKRRDLMSDGRIKALYDKVFY